MVNNKKNKIIMLIILISFGIICTIALILPLVIAYNADIKKSKIIYNDILLSLSKFDHNNVVYYEYEYIYYYNQEVYLDSNYNVVYIDDNSLLYYSNKNYTLLNSDNTKIEIKENKLNYSYNESFYINQNKIYYREGKDYYIYDYEIDNSVEISEEDYYNNKDGGNYKIIKNNNEYEIINNNSYNVSYLKLSDIYSNEEISKIYNIKSFKFGSYQVIDNCIFVKLNYQCFDLIVKYDILNNDISLYDWINRYNNDSGYYDYVNFYVFKDKISKSIERYFI